MTKDFSKPERDDRRSYSRHTPSDGYRNEGSFKPARPRLSRDAVDRAWENGASRTHADYHPRQNPQTSSTQYQGRPSPSSERFQQPQNHEPYDAPQDRSRPAPPAFEQDYRPRHEETPEKGPRRFDRQDHRAPETQGLNSERWPRNQRGPAPQSRGYRGPYRDERQPRFPNDRSGTPSRPSYRSENAPRSFERNEQRFQNDGPSDGSRRPYRSENAPRSFERNEQRFQNDRPSDGSRRPYRSENAPRSFERNERRFHSDSPSDTSRRPYRPESAPRSFERNERPPRFQNGGPNDTSRRPYRPENAPRSFERNERPPRFQNGGPNDTSGRSYRSENAPRSFERNERGRENFGRDRRPSGPPTRRDNYNPRWQSRPTAQRDYSTPDRPSHRPEAEKFEGDYERFNAHGSHEEPGQTSDKHVTRLPDGRVLKGSRPSQRKQARFWEDVTSDTKTLLPQEPEVLETSAQPKQAPEPTTQNQPEIRPTKPPRKRPEGKVKAVKTVKTVRTRDAGSKASKGKPKKKRAPDTQGPVMRPSQRGFKWPAAGE
jgi:hypothetical protein